MQLKCHAVIPPCLCHFKQIDLRYCAGNVEKGINSSPQKKKKHPVMLKSGCRAKSWLKTIPRTRIVLYAVPISIPKDLAVSDCEITLDV